jgi:hypothetical protein
MTPERCSEVGWEAWSVHNRLRPAAAVHGPPIHDVEHRPSFLLQDDVQGAALSDEYCVDECLRIRRRVTQDRVSLVWRNAVAELGAKLV